MQVAKLFTDASCITITAFISPYRADRDTARQAHEKSNLPFIEVFVDAPLSVVEQRDPKTGQMVRVDPDDDNITLGEMLRQEKFGAGMADQKNLDAEFARAVMTDGGFQVRACGCLEVKTVGLTSAR